MSKLKAKDPKSAEPTKPKILVFGKAGAGKTYGILDFPGVYYIDTEGGASRDHYTDKLKKSGGVYLGVEDGSLNGVTVLEQFQALGTEQHNYKTVVIDSLSRLLNSMAATEAERLGDKDSFGASKKPAVAWVRRLLNWTDKIDMNVIFICHQKDEWGGNGNNREVVGSTFDAWEKLEYELDLSLQITKQGASRYATPKKSRLLQFPEGEKFPWSYEEFAKRYGKEIIERTVKTIELATPEQVTEIERLLEVVKIPEADVEKWLTKAKASSFGEMDQETINKCINFLKDKTK